jgi:hypothetical protein
MKELDLEGVKQDYVLRIRPAAQGELDWFRRQPTLLAAVELAAMATNSRGKKYSHQTRIKKHALRKARAVLVANLDRLRGCRDFDQLFGFLDRLLEPIHGIGELYVYDTALRLGTKLGLAPGKVYLHAGTRVGARALGLATKAKVLEIADIPKPWRGLSPHEVEDILCIYKELLKGGKAAALGCGSPTRSWCS